MKRCHGAVVVRFIHLDLVVKYSRHVRAAEGQDQAFDRCTSSHWFQDGDEMFPYVSLVGGMPLERR